MNIEWQVSQRKVRTAWRRHHENQGREKSGKKRAATVPLPAPQPRLAPAHTTICHKKTKTGQVKCKS